MTPRLSLWTLEKKTAWKIFKESHRLLSDLGVGSLRDDTIKSAEKFVCRMYGIQKSDSTNSARHLLFSKTWKPEALPPTHDALRFHLMRVHYQAMIWRKANCPAPNLPTPTDSGWKKVASELKPELMSLSPIPKSCLEVIPVVARSNAQHCVANVARLDCSVQQCVHAINKTMMNLFVWIVRIQNKTYGVWKQSKWEYFTAKMLQHEHVEYNE